MTAITTLIPAFKPEYLGETLLSLRRQSVRDFRVVVSDDSPGAVITDMIRDRRFGAATDGLELTVVRGPGNGRLNHLRLVDLWAGSTPFMHLLMDDDVLFPGFYRAHLQAHARAAFSVTVSARWLSQDDAAPAWSLPLPAVVEDSPLRVVPLDAAQVFPTVVPGCENWLGELSNMVWTADAAAHYPRPPVDGLNYYGLLDVGAVLEAVGRQPVGFIREHLGVFRQHGRQTTHNVGGHGHKVCMLVWAAYALHAWAQQRIDARDTVRAISTTVRRCLDLYGEGDPVMDEFYALVQRRGGSLADLHTGFRAFWHTLLAAHPGTAPAAMPGDVRQGAALAA
jgi:glycosyltransferase involved in cell wall biosynthesis